MGGGRVVGGRVGLARAMSYGKGSGARHSVGVADKARPDIAFPVSSLGVATDDDFLVQTRTDGPH
jgi:hypothetical protein